MDWVLSITTLLANWGLGYSKGKVWMWILHAVNGAFWIVYSILIQQYGLIVLSIATVVIDIITAIKMKVNINE
jgi:hypothetical protein